MEQITETQIIELKFCPHCRSKKAMYKDGIVRGKQRYHCYNCDKTTIVPLDKPRVR